MFSAKRGFASHRYRLSTASRRVEKGIGKVGTRAEAPVERRAPIAGRRLLTFFSSDILKVEVGGLRSRETESANGQGTFSQEKSGGAGSRPSRRASNGGPLWRFGPEPVLPTEAVRNRRAHGKRGPNQAFYGHRFWRGRDKTRYSEKSEQIFNILSHLHNFFMILQCNFHINFNESQFLKIIFFLYKML